MFRASISGPKTSCLFVHWAAVGIGVTANAHDRAADKAPTIPTRKACAEKLFLDTVNHEERGVVAHGMSGIRLYRLKEGVGKLLGGQVPMSNEVFLQSL